jgi:hypothetical protein
LPGRALHLAIAISYLNGFDESGTVKLRPRVSRELGMDRHAAYRALRQLENTGLLSVVRARGESTSGYLTSSEKRLILSIASSRPAPFSSDHHWPVLGDRRGIHHKANWLSVFARTTRGCPQFFPAIPRVDENGQRLFFHRFIFVFSMHDKRSKCSQWTQYTKMCQFARVQLFRNSG